jgi:hypothetical protein
VNLHGAFIIGFVLLGTYFTGNMIYYFLADDTSDKPIHAARTKSLFIIGLLMPSGLSDKSFRISYPVVSF